MKMILVLILFFSHIAIAPASDDLLCLSNNEDITTHFSEVVGNSGSLIEFMNSWKDQDLPEEDCIINPYNKTTRELAEKFLSQMNVLFEEGVKFKFIPRTSPVAFSADTLEQTISFPSSYLNKVCRGDSSVYEMYFILAHEYAHTLIEAKDYRIDYEVSVWLKREMNNESEEFENYIYELSHFNIDSVAAKILKYFKYPVDDGIKWLESFKSLMPEMKEYHKYWEERPALLRQAYDEGRSGWMKYNKIFPLCNISKISVLFDKEQFYQDIKSDHGDISYISTLESKNIRLPEDSIFYSLKDIELTMKKWNSLRPTK